MHTESETQYYDVIVIGGGAAGLMCAFTAGQRGRRVALLEHTEEVGKKIAISGGGRCNFTNINASPDNYLSSNPDFCKSALARYTPWDFIALVGKHRIAFHEKKLGQQFCDGSSSGIIDMLLAECAAARVDVLCECRVREIRKPERFVLATNRGTLECGSLVVATGGLSFAKLGATDFGYRIARDFGLRVIETRPGLVPLLYAQCDLRAFHELSGVSLPVVIRHGRGSFAEAMLFTHRGLSGPAMLQISSYWQPPATIAINLFPGGDARAWLEENRGSAARLDTLLAKRLPERFATAWCALLGPPRPVRHYSSKELDEIARQLESWTLRPAGTEGYATAEVTVGGIDTRELSSKTMEARNVPGLHFIGEAVDVTGWLGGFNFQWAWASGHACGTAV